MQKISWTYFLNIVSPQLHLSDDFCSTHKSKQHPAYRKKDITIFFKKFVKLINNVVKMVADIKGTNQQPHCPEKTIIQNTPSCVFVTPLAKTMT